MHTRLSRDVTEMAVALVMVEVRERALEFAGRPVGASDLRQLEICAAIQLRRPANVIADEEIEFAVVVVIDPGSACAPAVGRAPDAGSLRHVTELAVTFISEEVISSNASNEDIHQPVVVVIADGNAHPVETDIQA